MSKLATQEEDVRVIRRTSVIFNRKQKEKKRSGREFIQKEI